jgi:hypothetical protein
MAKDLGYLPVQEVFGAAPEEHIRVGWVPVSRTALVYHRIVPCTTMHVVVTRSAFQMVAGVVPRGRAARIIAAGTATKHGVAAAAPIHPVGAAFGDDHVGTPGSADQVVALGSLVHVTGTDDLRLRYRGARCQ